MHDDDDGSMHHHLIPSTWSTNPLVLAIVLLMIALFASLAHAYEDSANVVTVSPSSGASASTSAGQLKSGEQYAVWCSGNANYRVCATGSTCTATANDYPVFQDKPIDVLMGERTLMALYGNANAPTCRIYRVVPKTISGVP